LEQPKLPSPLEGIGRIGLIKMLFDTSAWIELFQGTEKSKIVEAALKADETFTSIVTFSEIASWCLKNNLSDKITPYIEAIKKGSSVLGLDENISVAAGRINFERKKTVKNWGMMDSLIFATALFYNLEVLTKDSQFDGLSNVRLL
jgi:predicted nucleic acid-binding protein